VGQNDNDEVLIIGGGVIGVCCAYYLAAAGRRVTLVEEHDVCSGCSSGNAGLIVPSHCIPLASAGIPAKALQWMFDRNAPFYVKPRLDWELAVWLYRFVRNCRTSVMREAIPVIRDLTRASLHLFRELALIDSFEFGFEQKGLLFLFDTSAGLKDGREEAHLLREFGIGSEELDIPRCRETGPAIKPSISGGVYFPDDGQLIPADFVRGLARKAESMGVAIHTSTAVHSFQVSGGRISAVLTTAGEFRPSEVVVASGAWSSILFRELGVKLPLQAGKGYSLTASDARAVNLQTPLILHEARVAVTPMGKGIRFGGTLELSGLDTSINERRSRNVLTSAARYLSGIETLQPSEPWAGLRPCTPDGLPVIGRTKELNNLIIATGHAMLGITLGPITGKLVSELICGTQPTFDAIDLGPARFL
jgi:D-amino-acid dehydrogenase